MKPLHELDALCAEKVAGCVPCDNWKPFMHDSQMRIDDSCGHANCVPRSMWPPKYSENPAAVLSLLEKYDWVAGNHLLYGDYGDYFCEINYPESRIIERAPTFALAATLALLKAHGCEVGE